MGGMGFISSHHAQILHNNSLINIHTLDAARGKWCQTLSLHQFGVYLSRHFKQRLKSCRSKRKTRIRRFLRTPTAGKSLFRTPLHPLQGGLWLSRHDRPIPQYFWRKGHLGRRPGKSACGIMPKDRLGKLTGDDEIEIWGDGEQTRSFCYIRRLRRRHLSIMRSDFHEPLNLGQDRMVSINELAGYRRQDRRYRIDQDSDGPREFAGETRITRCFAKSSAGSRQFTRGRPGNNLWLDREAGDGR